MGVANHFLVCLVSDGQYSIISLNMVRGSLFETEAESGVRLSEKSTSHNIKEVMYVSNESHYSSPFTQLTLFQ